MSYDPCGHTKIAVSNFKKSYIFYKEIFEALSYTQVSNKNESAGWASHDGYGILITQAEFLEPKYKFDAPGLHHLCLKAKNTEIIDYIYKTLLQEKTHIFNPPQKFPDYTDKYYAVFFADPDGIKLEIAYY